MAIPRYLLDLDGAEGLLVKLVKCLSFSLVNTLVDHIFESYSFVVAAIAIIQIRRQSDAEHTLLLRHITFCLARYNLFNDMVQAEQLVLRLP